ncbi:MAG TPA: flavodoxin-dependent (E)-4-hydroxy-3-methylbut-2-enyl-diphosphate synthase [Firmicutes bacterium]|nr:flavodoxin-dependent (E)-4-hydroxy-3-methylbut-2-enyl-diphosphate synthase [Bacillota bacterium]
MAKKKKKEVKIGGLKIGGDNPVLVQSMTNTKTINIKETVRQIKSLEGLGCEIIRVAVPDEASAQALREIKRKIRIPLVADIHFDYRLALKSIDNGADKIRINPGNIGSKENLVKIIRHSKKNNIPIRIGVNSGSIDPEIQKRFSHPCPEALVESVIKSLAVFEREDFVDIVISVKSSDVMDTIEAYTLLALRTDYPLHLGITEAGTRFSGAVKSSVGLGILLNKGIGDTIRVSLAGNPEWEVVSAFEILKSLRLRERGVTMIVCPTCGRTEIPVEELADKVEKLVRHVEKPLKIAVMGCVVNGPGEAKDADLGIAGGKGKAVIFKKGKILKTVKEKDIFNEFKLELKKIILEEE